ncbi:MAG TPA: hypothetical protein VK028_01200 [Micromonosporaceae bacterium]|nr:hypothetical protein [Micromonosporaceae bacterium]
MTYQPPSGQQPESQPAYAPPQDPWAGGYEQGVASVPTDPIPQQYESYGGPGDAWSQQQTVLHGQQYAYVPQRSSRVGLFVLVFLLVLVLGGGGGFAAWYIVSNRPPSANPGPSTTNPPSESSSAAELPANCPVNNQIDAFDPCTVREGDCIINLGTEDDPDVRTSTCTEEGSFTVLFVTQGPDIPENAQGQFDRDTTSAAVCGDVEGFEFWYGYNDAYDDRKDVFFCLQRNKVP